MFVFEGGCVGVYVCVCVWVFIFIRGRLSSYRIFLDDAIHDHYFMMYLFYYLDINDVFYLFSPGGVDQSRRYCNTGPIRGKGGASP